MSYLLTGMLIAYVLITIGLVTVVMYYGNLAYQCDALVGFWCHTDWQCSDLNGVAANSGTYDAAGNLVPGDELGCHLKGLYGVDPGPECAGYTTRELNPCMITTSPDADRNDPNSYTGAILPEAYACSEDSPNYNPKTGLCQGTYSNSANIPGVTNMSNAEGSGDPNKTPQYGLGLPPTTPYGCACYFGTNVIANSGSPGGSSALSADSEGGGAYNISSMACGQIVNQFAPTT